MRLPALPLMPPLLLLLSCAPSAAPTDKEHWEPTFGGGKTDSTLDRGELLFGAAKLDVEIQKTEQHAYSFFAVEGSRLRIEMQSADDGVDPYLVLVDPTGTSWINDDGPDGLDALLEVDSVTETGTYRVIATTFRAAGSGLYDLELSCLSASCTKLPEPDATTIPVDGVWLPPEDPYNPETCTGTRLTSAVLKAMLPFPQTTERELGEVIIIGRRRTCYSDSECTDWEDIDHPVRQRVYYGSTNLVGRTFALTSPRLGIEYANDAMGFTFTTERASFPFGIDSHGDFDDSQVTAPISFSSLRNYASFVDFLGEDTHFRPAGVITDRCFGLVGSHEEPTRDANGNTVTVQYQAAIHMITAD